MQKRIFTNLTQLKNGLLPRMVFEVEIAGKSTINEITDICEFGRGFGTVVIETGKRMFFHWARCKFDKQGNFSFHSGGIQFRQLCKESCPGSVNFTEIKKIDDKGEMSRVALYSLPPKKALIAHYMQNVRKDFNTWKYPEELPGIKETKSGRFVYFIGDNTAIYTVNEGELQGEETTF